MQKAILESGKPKPKVQRAHVTQFGVVIDVLATLDAMGPDDSFTVDTNKMRKYVLVTGKQKGMSLTSQKEGERYRIHIK